MLALRILGTSFVEDGYRDELARYKCTVGHFVADLPRSQVIKKAGSAAVGVS
jgi:hypothetical protein